MVPTLQCRVALVPPTPFPKTYNSAGVQGGGERSGQVAGGRRAGGKMGHRAHQAGRRKLSKRGFRFGQTQAATRFNEFMLLCIAVLV